MNPSNTKVREMNRFAKHILQKFFEVSKTNKHIWMELCFWKTSREASEVVEGYGTQAASKVSICHYSEAIFDCFSSHSHSTLNSQREKASYWSEDDEEKLRRVFHQLKEMEEKENENEDMLDSITAFFTDSNKSRRQVLKKLKDLELIKVGEKYELLD